MSQIKMSRRSTPLVPENQKVILFINNNGEVSSIDHTGTVTVLSGGGGGGITLPLHTDNVEDSNNNTLTDILAAHASDIDLNTLKVSYPIAASNKLGTIEDDAKDDQTGAEIVVLLNGESDANLLSDTLLTKLTNMNPNATDDQTGAEIVVLIGSEPNANLLDNTQLGKVNSSEQNSKDDQTGAEIVVLINGESDANFLSDTELTNLTNFLTQDVSTDATPTFKGIIHSGGTARFIAQTINGDGTTEIDLTKGNKIHFNFGAQNEVFTFVMPASPCNLVIKITQDSVGGRSITWPVATKWLSGGTEPVLTVDANAVDFVSIYWDGTNLHGSASLNSI